MIYKKVKIYLFFIPLIWTSAGLAQDPQFYFESANRAYTDGDYQLAIDLYSKIIDQGIESGEVYFNLGNAYYKLDEIGLAILYFEKAKRFLEGDPALDQNLSLAQLKIVDKIDAIPVLFITEWWLKLTHLFSINTLLWVTFSFFTLAIVIAILQIIFDRLNFRKAIWVVSSLFIFMVIISSARIYEFETSEFGVILEEKISVVSEPGLSGTEVFILHEGTKVRINRVLDDWLEITIPDGKTGWVRDSTLEII